MYPAPQASVEIVAGPKKQRAWGAARCKNAIWENSVHSSLSVAAWSSGCCCRCNSAPRNLLLLAVASSGFWAPSRRVRLSLLWRAANPTQATVPQCTIWIEFYWAAHCTPWNGMSTIKAAVSFRRWSSGEIERGRSGKSTKSLNRIIALCLCRWRPRWRTLWKSGMKKDQKRHKTP